MDAARLLAGLTNEELYELRVALPEEFDTRGLDPLTAADARPGGHLTRASEGAAAAATAVRAGATPDTSESLKNQLPSALAAYRSVIAQLNAHPRRTTPVTAVTDDIAAKELHAWLTDDKLKFVTPAQGLDSALRFTLVAMPNALADAGELSTIAREFGKAQPHETYVWDEFFGMYTPEQLSASSPSDNVNVLFSLIPNKMDQRLTAPCSTSARCWPTCVR